MSTILLTAVITVLSTVMTTLVGLVFTGKLVPVSRAERAEAIAETYKQANTRLEEANRSLLEQLNELRMNARISNQVAEAVRQFTQGQGQIPSGGVMP